MAGEYLDVEVKGLKELEAKLNELGFKNAKTALRNSVLAGAKIVRDEARAAAPVKTGNLRKQIVSRLKRLEAWSTSAVYRVGIPRKRGDKKNAFYWWMLEAGAQPHPIKAKRKKILMDPQTGKVFGKTVQHPGVPARPFLRPALDNNVSRVIEAIRKRMAKRIEQIAAKGKR